MALSINPLTYVISVPQADLTFVSGSLYNHDTDAFRLELKSWEDSAEGMVQPKTHNHNTEVTVGGLTLARVIEILDPYTITYQDDQYAVNLVGSNNNIADKLNLNQVSVRSNNSAGLVKTLTAGDVWNELIAGHLTEGTTGETLSNAGAAGNPWATAVSGNTNAGTFGELVGKKLLTVGKFLGLK